LRLGVSYLAFLLSRIPLMIFFSWWFNFILNYILFSSDSQAEKPLVKPEVSHMITWIILRLS
jgi:hypothetical protein